MGPVIVGGFLLYPPRSTVGFRQNSSGRVDKTPVGGGATAPKSGLCPVIGPFGWFRRGRSETSVHAGPDGPLPGRDSAIRGD
jgi:hypothetical protein